MAGKNYYSADENAKTARIIRAVMAVMFVVLLIVLIVLVVGQINKQSNSDLSKSTEKQTTVAKSEIDSVLIVVNDDKYSSVKPLFALVSCNKTNGQINVFQLPYSYKIKSGEYSGTLNSLYNYSGGQNVQKGLSSQLGITIDHYIDFDLTQISKIVDRFGGLEFNVKNQMTYSLPNNELVTNLVKGSQNLNGSQVAQYLRYGNWNNKSTELKQRASIIVKLINQYINELDSDSLISVYEDFSNDLSTDYTIVSITSFCEGISCFQNESDSVAIIGDVSFSSALSKDKVAKLKEYFK